MTRKFYKTVIKVEVLSEEPFDYDNLSDIHNQITDGDCSGEYTTTKITILTAKQAASTLIRQGSDPEFFQLDRNGNDLED